MYIGSSNDIENRWAQHIYQLNNNIHGNAHLQNSWNKYGKSNFKFIILEETEPQEQFQTEQDYIDSYTLNGFQLYNITKKISGNLTGGIMIDAECNRCHKQFKTFSHLAKYCEECKQEMKKESYEIFKEAKQYYVNDNLVEEDVLMWGYENWNDFWESFV